MHPNSKKYLLHFLLTISLVGALLNHTDAIGQPEQTLSLRLSRDFGFDSGTGKIQGNFSLSVNGPDNLERVIFLIDGQVMGEVTEAPFRIRFRTGNYSLGPHTLSAIGVTSDGRELRSQEIRKEFVPAEEGLKTAAKIALPLLVIVFGMMIFAYVIPSIFSHRKPSSLPKRAPRNYFPFGGAICLKCGRPFALHFYGLNLLTRKLDRCPYCGHWGLVRRSSLDELRAAELAEADETSRRKETQSDEETLRKQLDESRFMDNEP